MTTIINLVNTVFSFYSHNWPLVYFGIFSLVCLVKLIAKPSRYYAVLLLGFLCLLFQFEYTKHLIPHIRENVTDLILVDPARRSFNLADLFFGKLFPMFLQVFGWFLIFVSIFILRRDKSQ